MILYATKITCIIIRKSYQQTQSLQILQRLVPFQLKYTVFPIFLMFVISLVCLCLIMRLLAIFVQLLLVIRKRKYRKRDNLFPLLRLRQWNIGSVTLTKSNSNCRQFSNKSQITFYPRRSLSTDFMLFLHGLVFHCHQ